MAGSNFNGNEFFRSNKKDFEIAYHVVYYTQ